MVNFLSVLFQIEALIPIMEFHFWSCMQNEKGELLYSGVIRPCGDSKINYLLRLLIYKLETN